MPVDEDPDADDNHDQRKRRDGGDDQPERLPPRAGMEEVHRRRVGERAMMAACRTLP
jgi:hypothetical protein